MTENYNYYSLKLGKSRNFLAVYKHNNRDLNLKTAKEWYEHVLARMDKQEQILAYIERIYYELEESRKVNTFCKLAVSMGIYNSTYGAKAALNAPFTTNREQGFIKIKAIDRYEKLIDLWIKQKAILHVRSRDVAA